MSNLIVNVEVLAGTQLEDAIKEASELARYLNVAYVSFSFNGVEMSISKWPDVEKIVKEYRQVIKEGSGKIVVG